MAARIVIKIKDEFFLQKETFEAPPPGRIIVSKDFFAPFNLNRLGLLYPSIVSAGNILESKTIFTNLLTSLNLIAPGAKLESLFSVTEATYSVNLMQMAKDRSAHIGENLLNYYFVEVDKSRVADILKVLNSNPKSGIDYAYLRAELADFNDSGSVAETPIDLSEVAFAPHKFTAMKNAKADNFILPTIDSKLLEGQNLEKVKQAESMTQTQSKVSNFSPTSKGASMPPPPPLPLILQNLFINCGIADITPPIPNVTVVDVEQGWSTAILSTLNIGTILGGKFNYSLNTKKRKHGTNTLNVLFRSESPDVLSTYNGLCSKAKKQIASVWFTNPSSPTVPPLYDSREAALASVLGFVYIDPDNITDMKNAIINIGDIVLLELQVKFDNTSNLPVEIEKPMFNVIQAGVKAGFVIIESAGNGGEDGRLIGYDLDSTLLYSSLNASSTKGIKNLNSESTGAIVVGAVSEALPYPKLPITNFGSRIDCFCFGDNSQTSSSLYYNSTSLASAMVAAIAANLQMKAKKSKTDGGTGRPLTITEIKVIFNNYIFISSSKVPNTNINYASNIQTYITSLPTPAVLLP